MHSPEEQGELSRQSLVRQARVINRGARSFFRERDVAVARAKTRAAFFTAHEAIGRQPFSQIVQYIVFAFGLVCVYIIDVLLFGSSAQYIASVVGGESDLWSIVVKYVVPAAFVGIEVLIALKIEEARYEEIFGFGSRAATRAWLAVGLLVAFVMPLVARVTADSAATVTGNEVPQLMVAALGLISLAAHVLVLFGGRLAHEAKVYLAFALARTYHDTLTELGEERAAKRLGSVNDHFIKYVHDWRCHNREHGELPSGPFDADVLELLQAQFPHVASARSAEVFPTGVET